MIECVTSQSGLPVLRVNGVLLASRFDPMAEARAWLERRQTLIDSIRTIFVLGWGCGYHVQALRERTQAKIIVIECNSEIYTTAKDWIHDLEDVHVEIFEQSADLRLRGAIREGVRRGSFIVLHHPASVHIHPKFYNDCLQQLLGRDWGSLNWQWNVRGRSALGNPPRIEPKGEPLTIHDLEACEVIENLEEREKLILNALRELVK